MIEENPTAKEIGLRHLCNFIEDCEPTMRVQIIHKVGLEGPITANPAEYIR